MTGVLNAQATRIRGVYRGWWIVALSFYSQMLVVAGGGYVFGVLILSMQDSLGWSQSAVVGPLTLNRWISGLIAVPLGPLVDRHGVRLSMTLSALLAGIGLILVAFAHTPLMFYTAWALFGFAQPGLGLLGPRVVIANWFVRRRARAFVLFTLGTSAAGLVAAPVAAVIDDRYGWRLVWGILGILCLSIAPLAWTAIRRRPEDLGLLPDGDPPTDPDATTDPPEPPPGDGAADAGASARASAVGRDVAVDTPWTVREALHTRAFWLLVLGFLLISMPTTGIFINISGFAQSHGFSKDLGAAVVSAYAFGSFSARPLWGYVLSKIGLYITLMAFATIYAIAITCFAVQTQLLPIFLTAVFLGFGISGSQLLQAQALPDYYGRAIVGSLTGVTTLGNVAVGGMAPQLTAIVFDRTGGYTPAFLFFSVACAIAAVAFFFARPPVHPSEREPVPTDPTEEAVRA